MKNQCISGSISVASAASEARCYGEKKDGTVCDKLLATGYFTFVRTVNHMLDCIEIKCPRCKTLNSFKLVPYGYDPKESPIRMLIAENIKTVHKISGSIMGCKKLEKYSSFMNDTFHKIINYVLCLYQKFKEKFFPNYITYYSQCSGVWSLLNNWDTFPGGGGTNPPSIAAMEDNQFVIQAGHNIDYDLDTSSWTTGFRTIKIQNRKKKV